MISPNHLLISANILIILAMHPINAFQASLTQILLFSFVFGVLVDLDLLIGMLMKKPWHHLRSWIHEPFGIILFGIPVALMFSTIKPSYFWLTIIPYTSHVIIDYLTEHEVTPLAPFSNKTRKVGIIKSWPHKHEKIILAISTALFLILAFNY